MNTSGTPGLQGTPAPPPAQGGVTALTLKPGDKIDNYEIVQQVGSGGSAVLFAAYDSVLDRTVAVKQIVVPTGDEGDDLRQRAVAEAKAHKRVCASDPAMLVRFIDMISEPRGLFLITEFVDGPSLEWILQSEPGPMEQRQALGILAATCKGLHSIHSANMVHRDMKPSNILLPRGGGLKIADFGLASALSEQQAMELGSVRYMAPELLRGEEATPASDLYSLGIVAYEMLAGRDKFNEAFRTILRDQRNQAMRWVKWHTNVRAKVAPLKTHLPDMPQSLSDMVERMMEKEPSRRVGSCAELMEAIRLHFASEQQGGTVPTLAPHQAMQPADVDDVSETAAVPKRSKVPMLLAIMLGVWVLAIAGYFVYDKSQKNQAQRDRITALAGDINEADQLHTANDYDTSRRSFMDLRQMLREDYEASPAKFKDDYLALGRLAAAGIFRAEGMLHVQASDFVAALDSFNEYKKTMGEFTDDPADAASTSLSLQEASTLVDSHLRRADFQRLADQITAHLDAGELDAANQKIRSQLELGVMAESDAETLEALNGRYRQLRNTAANDRITAQAQALVEDGDVGEAIELLEDTIDDDPAAADPVHRELLAALTLDVRREESDEAIRDAEADDDMDDLIEALGDRIAFDPDNDEFVERYNLLVNNRDSARAGDLMAAGRINEAVAVLEQILSRDPDHVVAQQQMASIGTLRQFEAKKREAEQAFGRREYTEAIELANQAIDLGGDRDGRMNEIIDLSTGQMALDAATAAFDAGDLDTAERQLAVAIGKLGNTPAIRDLDRRITELRDYRTHVANGDAHFRRGEYGPAKRDYLAAQQVFSNQTIEDKIRDCDFHMWLVQCDQAIARRLWDDAASALSRAEEIKVNDETRQRREQIDDNI